MQNTFSQEIACQRVPAHWLEWEQCKNLTKVKEESGRFQHRSTRVWIQPSAIFIYLLSVNFRIDEKKEKEAGGSVVA